MKEASGLAKHHVKRAKKYGGGLFVNVEGLHHLHCLNLLRKSLYFNHEYYGAINDDAFGVVRGKTHGYPKPMDTQTPWG
ncbi:hypothetical protein B0T16DRAFT_451253 [Cercophora newfieldiana]|uniref:Uncharacterized protein n=1 Tax=Cercophora newfieldiana TaxID=92897 RepID=A0AA39YPZ5_9PEZI|nr:hypothetical protein B0T16DRAFT_451253 [Cercophora newfieldiana]